MIRVIDGFLENPDRFRESALKAGFGTWSPNKGDIGAEFYQGVGFWGDHATAFRALHNHVGQIIPSSMFFRVTNPGMEHALIHSDREYGDNTAILYLTNSPGSGTAFYRHRATGMTDMPPLSQLICRPDFQNLRKQMLDASEDDWEQYQFVEGKVNRCLVFDAPKIHCRIPKDGFGTDERNSRMVWVCHFNDA